MIEILLAGSELAHALRGGQIRHDENVARGIPGKYGGPDDGAESLEAHKRGAVGEAALAKAIGVPWTKGDYRRPDVGELEVRTTRPGLILRPADRDGAPFVLARILERKLGHRSLEHPVHVQLLGWIRAGDGKVPAYWTNFGMEHRPMCWCVPVRRLLPIEPLLELHRRRAAG